MLAYDCHAGVMKFQVSPFWKYLFKNCKFWNFVATKITGLKLISYSYVVMFEQQNVQKCSQFYGIVIWKLLCICYNINTL